MQLKGEKMPQDSKLSASDAGCIVLIVLPMFLLCFGGCYGLSHLQTSDGYRDSAVRKLSRSGLIWKTWEAETLGDGLRVKSSEHGQSVSPETFTYTVDNPEVVKQLQALPPGQRVRIHYRKMAAAWQPRGETSYFITSVERLAPETDGRAP